MLKYDELKLDVPKKIPNFFHKIVYNFWTENVKNNILLLFDREFNAEYNSDKIFIRTLLVFKIWTIKIAFSAKKLIFTTNMLITFD